MYFVFLQSVVTRGYRGARRTLRADRKAASDTQINLSWAASTDNVGVTGYKVERFQGAACSNFAQIAATTATTFNDTGLAPSTSYSYRVTATAASSSQINRAWSASTDDVGVTGYKV